MKQNKAIFWSLIERFSFMRVNHSMHISLKHGYLYYETPKCACSTIKRRLQILELADTPIRPTGNVHNRMESPLIAPAQLPREQLNGILKEHRFPKFCFVRNPYTRVLSAYLDKIVRDEPQKAGVLKALGRNEADTEISFPEFLGSLLNTPPQRMDPHWMPQAFHLSLDLLDYNFIGRFECFEKDFQTALRMILPRETRENLRAVTMDAHKTEASSQLETYFDGSCVDLVRQIFQNDFEALGYSTDPADALLA